MNLKRLGKQFRRELTNNPKKAAILGLLAIVALYFWFPLVRGWISPENPIGNATASGPATVSTASLAPGTAAGANAATVVAGTPATTAPESKNAENARYSWQQVVKWRNNDGRTFPVHVLSPSGRDPFGTPRIAAPKAQVKKPEASPPVITPQGLGLVLTGTVTGGGRQIAHISGRTYRQGKSIDLIKDGQPVSFILAEVYPRRVVLTRQQERYELTIPDGKQSGRMEVVIGSKK